MTIKDRFKRAISGFWDNGNKKSFSSSMRSGTNHPVLQLIGAHHQSDTKQDPRQKIGLSRVLIKVLPFFQSAIDLQTDLIGRVNIKSENEELKKVLSNFIKKVPIKFEDNTDLNHFFGLNSYNRQLVKVALSDGMAFSEDWFSSELDGELDGLLIYKTEKFNFEQDKGKKVLTYKSTTGATVQVLESDHFNIFGVSFLPGSLWGLSMVDGGEFFSEILIQMLVARKDNYLRLGSPAGLNVFKVNESGSLKDDEWNHLIKQLEEGEQKFTNAVGSMDGGVKKEVFMKLPSMVDFEHKMYGEGAPGMTGFKEDFIIILRILAQLTGIPVEFWLESSGGGIGSEKFEVLKGLLSSKIGTIRNLLEPINKRVLINYLISIDAPPIWLEDFEVIWEDLDISDKKRTAETQKLEAETMASVVATAEKMFLELGSSKEAVNDFLNKSGFPSLDMDE